MRYQLEIAFVKYRIWSERNIHHVGNHHILPNHRVVVILHQDKGDKGLGNNIVIIIQNIGIKIIDI